MRVLVTGASGLLGLNVCLMQASHHDIYGVANTACMKSVPFELIQSDLTVNGSIREVFEWSKPELIINCAAMAQVDQCEEMPEKAWRINAWMPGQIAALSRANGIPLIHISTDAVFDGRDGGYAETDQPNPVSVYAQTKLDGENRVFESDSEALVVRVNFFGHSRSGSRSLAEFFLRNLLDRNPVNGFTDVVFSPLYVKHLAEILFNIAEKHLIGLFHVVGTDKISKYDFGCMIAEKLSCDKHLITPISVKDAGLKAKRAPNLYLDVTKLEHTGIDIPSLDDGLEAFIRDYRQKWRTIIQATA